MITVRPYRNDDWEMVRSWWIASGEVPPIKEMMPEDSSFVAMIDGRPAVAVAIYLTNTKASAMVENFVGNPNMKGDARKEASRVLSDYIAGFAKRLGYMGLLCMTEKDVLKHRYVELGFVPTLSGVTTLVRAL